MRRVTFTSSEAAFTVFHEAENAGVLTFDNLNNGDVVCADMTTNITVPAGQTWYAHVIGAMNIWLPAGQTYYPRIMVSTNNGATWSSAGPQGPLAGDFTVPAHVPVSMTTTYTMNAGGNYRFALEPVCTITAGGTCPISTVGSNNMCSMLGFVTGTPAL